jgi:hypothetical protein
VCWSDNRGLEVAFPSLYRPLQVVTLEHWTEPGQPSLHSAFVLPGTFDSNLQVTALHVSRAHHHHAIWVSPRPEAAESAPGQVCLCSFKLQDGFVGLALSAATSQLGHSVQPLGIDTPRRAQVCKLNSQSFRNDMGPIAESRLFCSSPDEVNWHRLKPTWCA